MVRRARTRVACSSRYAMAKAVGLQGHPSPMYYLRKTSPLRLTRFLSHFYGACLYFPSDKDFLYNAAILIVLSKK